MLGSVNKLPGPEKDQVERLGVIWGARSLQNGDQGLSSSTIAMGLASLSILTMETESLTGETAQALLLGMLRSGINEAFSAEPALAAVNKALEDDGVSFEVVTDEEGNEYLAVTTTVENEDGSDPTVDTTLIPIAGEEVRQPE